MALILIASFGKRNIIPSFLFLISLLSCQSNTDTGSDIGTTSKDTLNIALNKKAIESCSFCFIIEREIDVVNSADSSFTRRYEDEDKSVELSFTAKELASIRKSYRDNQLNDLPLVFKPNCPEVMQPTSYTTVTLTIDGKTTQLFLGSPWCTDSVTVQRLERIHNFINLVEQIVYKKQSVRDLPESDLKFL